MLRRQSMLLIQPYCKEFTASTVWMDNFAARNHLNLDVNAKSKYSKYDINGHTGDYDPYHIKAASRTINTSSSSNGYTISGSASNADIEYIKSDKQMQRLKILSPRHFSSQQQQQQQQQRQCFTTQDFTSKMVCTASSYRGTARKSWATALDYEEVKSRPHLQLANRLLPSFR